MRSGYRRLVRVRQLIYWTCQCEQIIFEVRSNISLSVLAFSANFIADAVMDKGESAGVFAQLHRNWKWYDLGRRTWGWTSKFSKQLHGKWIHFPVINLKNYISMKLCWTLCSKYTKKIFSTCSFKGLSGCTELYLTKSHSLDNIRDLKMPFFRRL